MPWRIVCNDSELGTSTAKACEASRNLALPHAFAVLVRGSIVLQTIGESMPPSARSTEVKSTYSCAASFFGAVRLSGSRRPRLFEVPPRKTKHISLNVCSPNVTNLGGFEGLFGFLELLS